MEKRCQSCSVNLIKGKNWNATCEERDSTWKHTILLDENILYEISHLIWFDFISFHHDRHHLHFDNHAYFSLMLFLIIFCSTLYNTIKFNSILCYTVQNNTVLYCTVLNWTELKHTTLYNIILYYGMICYTI